MDNSSLLALSVDGGWAQWMWAKQHEEEEKREGNKTKKTLETVF